MNMVKFDMLFIDSRIVSYSGSGKVSFAPNTIVQVQMPEFALLDCRIALPEFALLYC